MARGTPLGAQRGSYRRRDVVLEEPYGEVSLFPLAPLFNGPDLSSEDHARLTAQQARIMAFMRDGQWHTLRDISYATQAPEASVSAQLRHLRKVKFGSHVIGREHRGGGLYAYRLVR